MNGALNNPTAPCGLNVKRGQRWKVLIGSLGISRVPSAGPGKARELKFFISRTPTQTIDVNTLNQKEHNGLGEKFPSIQSSCRALPSKAGERRKA